MSFGGPCMMFTCFSVIAVFVKIPTRATTTRARLGSNDGEGEPIVAQYTSDVMCDNPV